DFLGDLLHDRERFLRTGQAHVQQHGDAYHQDSTSEHRFLLAHGVDGTRRSTPRWASLPLSGRGEPAPTGVSTDANRSHRVRHRAAGGACNASSMRGMYTLSMACQEDTRRAPFKTIPEAFKWGRVVLQKRSHTVHAAAAGGAMAPDPQLTLTAGGKSHP